MGERLFDWTAQMLSGDTAQIQGTADPELIGSSSRHCTGDSIETECTRLRIVAQFEQDQNTLTAATISAAATMLEEQGVCCLQGVLDVEVAGRVHNKRLSLP